MTSSDWGALGGFLAFTGISALLAAKSSPSETAFIQAIKAGNSKYVAEHAALFPTLDLKRDANENTPFMIACKVGLDSSAIMALLTSGSDISLKNRNGETPLHLALGPKTSPALVRILLKNKADPNAVMRGSQFTPLHLAVVHELIEVMSILLEKGASIDAKAAEDMTPLYIACANGVDDAVALLLANNADTKLRGAKDHLSPLVIAVANRNTGVVKQLLHADPDLVEVPMENGGLPIHAAVEVENLELVDLLLASGADITKKKRSGEGVMSTTVGRGQLSLCRELLKRGADVLGMDSFGTTPLHFACRGKHLDIVQLLIDHCPKTMDVSDYVNCTDKDGSTPLQALCGSNVNPENHSVPDVDLKILELLVDNGAKVNQQDLRGSLALHTASCRKWNLKIVEKLLDLDIKTAFTESANGRTALHLLKQVFSSHTDIIALLEKKMREYDSVWFETFDSKRILDVDEVVLTSLDPSEQAAVLDGELSLAKIAEKITSGSIKNVVVMTGAGISTSAGIPDFRSQGKGLYSTYKHPSLSKMGISAREIFTLPGFIGAPEAFFDIVKKTFLKVATGEVQPTAAHKFLKYLQDEEGLTRLYSQNIDTLEERVGITRENLVLAHGSFYTAHCVSCAAVVDEERMEEHFWSKLKADQLPSCPVCAVHHEGPTPPPNLRPGVTFFGERLPVRFFDCQDEDFAKCDLLIVMGTSLKVYPFAGLVSKVSETTPRLLFNNEAVGVFTKGKQLSVHGDDVSLKSPGIKGTYRDLAVLGSIDEGVTALTTLIAAARAKTNSLDGAVPEKRKGEKGDEDTEQQTEEDRVSDEGEGKQEDDLESSHEKDLTSSEHTEVLAGSSEEGGTDATEVV